MLTYEFWDKKSKINGVTAKSILANSRYKNADAIFLIKNGQTVVQMQAHKPDVKGVEPMTEDEAIVYAQKAIDERMAVLATVIEAETETAVERSGE